MNNKISSDVIKTETSQGNEKSLARLAAIGAIGNVLEWYDFAIYGFFASILAVNYFPSDNPTVSLIASFGAFAAGFLMRPVGGALFGHIGDTIGRNRALFLSILLMAVPTGLLALLPTYEVWGVWAAILVVVLRMAQGLAVGFSILSAHARTIIELGMARYFRRRHTCICDWFPHSSRATGNRDSSPGNRTINRSLPPSLAWHGSGFRASDRRGRRLLSGVYFHCDLAGSDRS